mgnify:CR=1 FL=1
MKNVVIAVFLGIVSCTFLFSQQMTQEKLYELIAKASDSVNKNGNSIQFLVKDRLLICISDANANRMRIISPITERKQLDDEMLLNALVANFHTALDVKYAISDEIIWSVFIHPLKELSDNQVLDAISQVYYANINFGGTFSSTSLIFPGNTQKKEEKKQPLPLKKF